MSSLESALALNNEGVDLLLCGNSKMAIASLSKSLKMIKKLLLLAGEATPTGTTTSSSNGLQSGSFSKKRIAETVPIKYNTVQNQNSFVYSNAIKLSINKSVPNQQQQQQQDDEAEMTELTACIIFNIALIHHLVGTTTSGNLSCMATAEKCYLMIPKLLDGCAGACTSSTAGALCLLAALNNLAQIQSLRGSPEQAKDSFEYLESLLYSDEETFRSIFTASEWESMMLNILFKNPPRTAPAA
jgi:hypothetical protein